RQKQSSPQRSSAQDGGRASVLAGRSRATRLAESAGGVERGSGSARTEHGRNPTPRIGGRRTGGTGLRPDEGPRGGAGTECCWIVPLESLGDLCTGAGAARPQATDAGRRKGSFGSTSRSLPGPTASHPGRASAAGGTRLVREIHGVCNRPQ